MFGLMCADDLSAQGHLSPDAGFIYNVEQDATYYFLNVAPQFQSFNNGNWKSLEINTRDLATKYYNPDKNLFKSNVLFSKPWT